MTLPEAVHKAGIDISITALIISTFWLFAKEHIAAGVVSFALTVLLIAKLPDPPKEASQTTPVCASPSARAP